MESNDDVARIFRENDNLGADSSLLLRATRQLLVSGKPMGPLTLLAVKAENTGAYPFGIFTHTKNNRIVFWPVLPHEADMVASEDKPSVVDHLTLELENRKTHVTAYDGLGQPLRRGASDFGYRESWKLHQFGDSGLALWFEFLVRWSLLVEQDTIMQRKVKVSSPAHGKKLEEFFKEIATNTRTEVIVLPSSTAPEYVFCAVYLDVTQDGNFRFSSDVLPSLSNREIEELPEDSLFEVRGKLVPYQQGRFVIAAACPPGKLRQEVTFGLPRSKRPE